MGIWLEGQGEVVVSGKVVGSGVRGQESGALSQQWCSEVPMGRKDKRGGKGKKRGKSKTSSETGDQTEKEHGPLQRQVHETRF